MPVRKHKVTGPLKEYEGEVHIVVEGPLSKRDLTSLQKYRDQQLLTLRHIQSDSLEFISDWADLRDLRLYGCRIGKWSPLTGLQSLEHLFLNGMRDRQPDLSFLSQLTRLEKLGVGAFPHWTVFPDMSRCTRLKRLHIFGCKRLADLSAVPRIPNLESFGIVQTPQEPNDLLPIMAMPKMKAMSGAFGSRKKDDLFQELLKKHGLVYG